MEHNLKLNASKSYALFFGAKKKITIAKQQISLEINNIPLNVVDSTRNLGIILDTELRFREHVKILIQKAYINLKLLYSSKHLLNKTLKRNLCDSLVLSHFNYCDFIYGPCLDLESRNRIQKIQNSCCRLACNLRKYDHVSNKIKELGWLKMEKRRILHLANFTHRLITGNHPSPLRAKFQLRHQNRLRDNLRNDSVFSIPRYSTSFFRRGYVYNAIMLYNSLPENFKNLSFKKFKIEFKKYQLSMYRGNT